MSFIQNLSIRNKLILISLIPLAALVYFLADSVVEDLKTRNNLQHVYEDVQEIENISHVMHQLLRERGHSISYFITNGRQERVELFNQREATDKAISDLRQILRNQKKEKNFGFLDVLPQIRSNVNSLEGDADSVVMALLDLNSLLIDEETKILNNAREPEISQHLKAHLFLSYSKVFLGELRTKLYQAAQSDDFRGEALAEAAALKGKYEINLQQFSNNASPELLAEFGKIQATPAAKLSDGLLNAIFSQPDTLSTTTSALWRENVTSYLNSLKTLEDFSARTIRQLAENKLDETSGTLTRNLAIALIVVLGIAVLLYFTITAIVSSINRLKDAADRIARGDVNFTVQIESQDEVGMLGNSFNQLVQVTKEYSQAAEIIGSGDYSPVVQVRSDDDTLGIALNNMKQNLRKLAEENEKRTWLLSGTSELNDKMRGEREVRDLAQEIVNKLVVYLKAQIGAIYLYENNCLSLVGSYAYHHRKENNNQIKLGQGLVGQAALEKKPIIFSPVPDNYIKINSGLGQASPKSIIVFPFLYDNALKGIIEIGSANELSELDLQFLNLVAENIGIAFNSSQSRTQLQELLEETQRQTEELEAQQEELRQINEELQEKTELLERSEAELKAQQEELQQTNEELEEKANLLEVQRDELEVAKMEVETKARELEITSKYKSEFLANMSHELRTPLNSMLILAQILSENKSQSLGPKETEFANNIYSSGKDLLTLINEILDLSKVESGKIELDIAHVELPEVIGNLNSTFEEIAKNKSINFSIQYNEDDFKKPFSSDQQRLEQILRNLLSNAFKFTGTEGSVSLQVKKGLATGEWKKNSKLRYNDEVIEFTVADSGIGIPKGKLGVVFEAFQQADGSTKRKYGGTGLGLSISRELAHALGGEIQVSSEEGKGSVFTLYLPLEFDPSFIIEEAKEVSVRKRAGDPSMIPLPEHNEEPSEGDISDDRYTIKANDKVILIVEDDVKFSNVLLDFMRKKGYKGILAHQGNTGLSLARHYRPDAIILDMRLPVMNGAEVLKHLKNDPNLRHIPVQVVSGYDNRKEGFELGAFDFLKKPLSKGDLDSAIGRIEEFVSRKLKRLLVVEDDKKQNVAIQELIGNGDVRSVSAFTGAEAYEIMQKEKFDCVIIDLGLPDMTGLALMEKIKADEHLNKTPIIVYTGKDLTKEEVSHLNKLANTVVLKTVDSHERLLDEAILFLHRVESRLPLEKQQIIRSLHRTEEVLKNKKVLIVDDDIRNIYSLTNALEEEGVRCITAENGKAAISTLQEHPDTDIVLMDIMMPEMDGFEATREIRRKSKFAKLPVIALTAKAMKGDREKCLEAGMSDYISKPVNVEQLLSLMRVWLYK